MVNKRILIIRLGAVGDVIRTLPVLKEIKKKYFDYQIDWIVEEASANILKDNPYLNEIIILPRKKIVSLFKEHKYKELYQLIKEIKKKLKEKKYFIVYDFHGILKSGILSFLTGAPIRIGFSPFYSKELNFLFNKKWISPQSKYITRIERNFALIEKELNIDELEWNIVIPEEDKIYINNFLKETNLEEKKIIGINPAVSSFGRYKEWFVEYYAKLIDLISNDNKEFEFVLTWGPGEEEKVNKIKELTKKRVIIAPKTTLKQLAYLISKFSYFISGDTGPMHLAEAMGTKVIAIFGPSDVRINRPIKKTNIAIFTDVGCNPCRNRKCKLLKCQYELTPDFVYEELKKRDYLK
ncbi:MAG TPA: glycosyltransferase family 9 protein [bacterium]|nr:glycosyltransferase family 9 protein [bacterium]HOL47070.1 glycosyltransferase family 9 protein [bacterium]HPQ18970.1 glycosyltransferase family 9 protein [bacterium]